MKFSICADKIFNPTGTWMDHVKPELLLRFWRKKGSPGVFILRTRFGFNFSYYSTPSGELRISHDSLLTGDIHELTPIPS